MDSETFLLMGFMVLPMLFVMFGLMQRMQGRRRELPAPPVSPYFSTNLKSASTTLSVSSPACCMHSPWSLLFFLPFSFLLFFFFSIYLPL